MTTGPVRRAERLWNPGLGGPENCRTKHRESLGLKRGVMDTYTLDPRRWRVARIFGRNPLLRRSDRVEALLVVVVLVLSLVVIPVAGVVGAVVYGARDRHYTQQARERHAATATVTDTAVDGSAATVLARWPVGAGERIGPVHPVTAAKAGERIQIWLDKDGNLVAPPTPTCSAVGDAVATVMAILLISFFGMTSFVTCVLSRLDRARDAEWELALRCLHEDEGRKNQR